MTNEFKRIWQNLRKQHGPNHFRILLSSASNKFSCINQSCSHHEMTWYSYLLCNPIFSLFWCKCISLINIMLFHNCILIYFLFLYVKGSDLPVSSLTSGLHLLIYILYLLCRSLLLIVDLVTDLDLASSCEIIKIILLQSIKVVFSVLLGRLV